MEKEYKVVMIMRKSDSTEIMEELQGIDFDELGVKLEVMEDAFFDSYIAKSSGTRICYEG